MHMLCRKVPFTYLMNQIAQFFPSLYGFYPRSFNLPAEWCAFARARAASDRAFVIKPDGGSLGQGIEFVEPGQPLACPAAANVAQEYVDSHLIGNRKFDLRVYCLIASVRPLRIFVYRDGVARFCADETSAGTAFSRITNVGLNREREGVAMPDISRLISDVFGALARGGADTRALWAAIDEVVVLSVLAGFGHIEKSERMLCPSCGYPRCFQILGFDILLDRELRPHVLEVNYRPSLDFYRPAERRMKVAMVRDALRIVLPYETVQDALLARGWAWTIANWPTFVKENPSLMHDAPERRRFAIDKGGFVQVWPNENDVHMQVLRLVKELAKEPIPVALLGASGLDTAQEEA
jgi:hypothetical protein